jgi:hypothetical protein
VNSKRFAWVMAVAGISLCAPYVVAVVAGKYPTSPVAKFNATLHQD